MKNVLIGVSISIFLQLQLVGGLHPIHIADGNIQDSRSIAFADNNVRLYERATTRDVRLSQEIEISAVAFLYNQVSHVVVPLTTG